MKNMGKKVDIYCIYVIILNNTDGLTPLSNNLRLKASKQWKILYMTS